MPQIARRGAAGAPHAQARERCVQRVAMKRAFLFSIGFLFIVSGLAPLSLLFSKNPPPFWLCAAVTITFMAIASLAIYAAERAPTSPWPQTIIGWVLGYVAIQAIGAVGLFILFLQYPVLLPLK
jgi:hypothetical protein